MRIAFEGPELTLVDFDNILNNFKEKNYCILLQTKFTIYKHMYMAVAISPAGTILA